MRKNKKRLVLGSGGVLALAGASVLALSAVAFESGVKLAPGANETGLNYESSTNSTVSVLLADGAATLNNPTIGSYGSESMAVALQGAADLTLNNAFVTVTGDNSVAFLFDNGTQNLTVRGSLLGGVNKVAVAQNGSFATLNLLGNDKINGRISTDASSSLNVLMGEGNVFRGSFNGNVNLALSGDSILYLTGDSFVNTLSDDLVDYSNIYLCGYTLTSGEGLIAGNDADCGELVGGSGAPSRPVDGNPPVEPEPEPQPQPQPDPEPQPQPQPQPEPEPEVYEPVYDPGYYYNPNTLDNIIVYVVVGVVALIGIIVSGILIFKSSKKKKE